MSLHIVDCTRKKTRNETSEKSEKLQITKKITKMSRQLTNPSNFVTVIWKMMLNWAYPYAKHKLYPFEEWDIQ